MLTYAAELATASLEYKLLWDKIQYLGIASIPIIWFLYLCFYTSHRKYINLRLLVPMGLFSILTAVMAFTNEMHGVIW